jgi:hypothetical protein
VINVPYVILLKIIIMEIVTILVIALFRMIMALLLGEIEIEMEGIEMRDRKGRTGIQTTGSLSLIYPVSVLGR